MATLIRILAWLLALVVVALPLAAVLNGWMTPGRWPIRQLQVTAEYRHVDEAQIRAVVVAHTGQGYFDTDPGEVRAALAALPWVDAVEVRKRWPDRLEVRLSEHHAQARWGDERLLSDRGVLFAVPDAAAMQDLPRLAGPDDRSMEVVEFHEKAGRLLRAGGLDVVGARLSPRGSWSLQLADGASVVVGREAEPELRLERLVRVLPQVLGDGSRRLARIDLRYTNGFAVRWDDTRGVEGGRLGAGRAPGAAVAAPRLGQVSPRIAPSTAVALPNSRSPIRQSGLRT